MKYAYNAVLWMLLAIDAVALIVVNVTVFALTYFFDPQRRVIHALSYYWGLHYYWYNPLWGIRYDCQATIDRSQAYVIVCNHQSMFDICLMYKLPLVFKWVSKREVFKIPIIGLLLKLHGDILIDRGDTQSAKMMLRKAEQWIKRGCSIAVFPEGTRSADGEIHDFKEGAFMIAKLNRLPILPVVMDGTRKILPAWSALFGGCATGRMRVLPVVDAATVAATKTRDLSAMLHTQMCAALAALKEETK